MSKPISILLLSTLLLTACAGAAGTLQAAEQTSEVDQPDQDLPDDLTPTEEESSTEPTKENECEDPFDGVEPRFSTGFWEKTNFCLHSVDYEEIFSGGPPPDGIPAIDEPQFVSPQEADQWLEDPEPVISVRIGEDARAYPLQIMTWHEIVNDTVGGLPVVITFCPLCNTALVFERPEIDGTLLNFGTSGNLRNSDLVMYDRQTESWWQQFTGEAIVGDLTGTQLQFIPATISSWEDFKNAFPEGEVLSRDTGYSRDYGRNPYIGYDDVNNTPFLFEGEVSSDVLPMERVVGIVGNDGTAVSYLLSQLQEEQVINGSLGSLPIAIFWKEGTASALDTREIPDGRDVGTTAVFIARSGEQELTFTAQGEGLFMDEETGTTWDIFGEALSGSLAGEALTGIAHYNTFWFAWAAFENSESLQE